MGRKNRKEETANENRKKWEEGPVNENQNQGE